MTAMASRGPSHRFCRHWLAPVLLLACNKQTAQPTSRPVAPAEVTVEPVQPEIRESAIVEETEETEEPELTGATRYVKPGEARSGLYENPGASPLRSKDEIKQVVRAHLLEIRACYERGLVRVPGLNGTLRVSFTIPPGGAVESAQTELGFPDELVADCITGIVKTFVFPPAPGTVVVTYPFVLKTSDG
jgi:hypothetical protein